MTACLLEGFLSLQGINYGDARNLVEEFVTDVRKKLEKGEKLFLIILEVLSIIRKAMFSLNRTGMQIIILILMDLNLFNVCRLKVMM